MEIVQLPQPPRRWLWRSKGIKHLTDKMQPSKWVFQIIKPCSVTPEFPHLSTRHVWGQNTFTLSGALLWIVGYFAASLASTYWPQVLPPPPPFPQLTWQPEITPDFAKCPLESKNHPLIEHSSSVFPILYGNLSRVCWSHPGLLNVGSWVATIEYGL